MNVTRIRRAAVNLSLLAGVLASVWVGVSVHPATRTTGITTVASSAVPLGGVKDIGWG